MINDHGPFNLLLVLGAVFLLGLAADLAGRRARLPRVTLLLLCGIAVGPSGFGLLPRSFVTDWFPVLTDIALALIGFLLGQKMSLAALRKHGRLVLTAALGETTGALVAVALALIVLGVNPIAALLMGAIGTATDPAATFDVVHERNHEDAFGESLLAIVAVDDAVALLWFIMMMAFAGGVNGDAGLHIHLWSGLVEIGGSVLLGALLGLPMALLTGRIQQGEPTQAEAIGFVLLCGGIAIWLGLSSVLSAMTMGAVVASRARHHKRPFHAIEGIEWPFMILFFVLAGASARLDLIMGLGLVVAVYMLARCVGSYLGCNLSVRTVGAPPAYQHYLGFCLFPQAGVAIGMALLASQRFPEHGSAILPAILASTVLFEIFAPPVTRWALGRVSASAD